MQTKKRVLPHYSMARNPSFCVVILVVTRLLLRDFPHPLILAVFVSKIVILGVLLLSKILVLIIFYTTIFVKRFWVVF